MSEKLKKSFKVNGWEYVYTRTGVQIINPEGHPVGKPVPLPTKLNLFTYG